LWLFVTSVVNLAGFAWDWSPEPVVRSTQVVGLLSLTVFPFATGLVLSAFSDWVSRRVASTPPQASLSPMTVDPTVVHRIGVSLLGLWLVVQALPELVQAAALYISMMFARPPELPRDEATEYKIWTYAQAGNARFASLVARLLIGLALYAGPGRVAQATLGGLKRFFGPPIPEQPTE
jgi:hypothetical protein